MSTKSKTKLSDILKEAKKSIQKGDDHYICYAIQCSRRGTTVQKDHLLNYIQNALYPHCFYEAWMRSNHNKFYKTIRHNTFDFKCGRIAWLNWLIKGLEKEGR